MKINFVYILLGLLLVSCGQIPNERDYYPKDSTISTIKGAPIDMHPFYFPTILHKDTMVIKTEMDTFMQLYFSSALFAAQEPILYNYYLGHDIYRFLLLRSFHKPVVFILHKDSDKVWLTTKELDRYPHYIEILQPKLVTPTLLPNGAIDSKEPNRKEDVIVDSISIADRNGKFRVNETKQLTEKEWTEFEKLLNNYRFWSANPYEEIPGCDGSEWIIEAHIKNKYWFVYRWSPNDDFRKAGEYLIHLSGFKGKVY